MKNNHTQLKRLAAISLVVVMCLSTLPMLAPSMSAADDRDILWARSTNGQIPMIRSPSPLHDELLEPDYNILGQEYALTSDGTIYSIPYSPNNRLDRSTDGGVTWDTIWTFDGYARTVYVSMHNGKEYIWVGVEGGRLYRSDDGGETFEISLNMDPEKIPYHWSFASNDEMILVGEYTGTTRHAGVYKSTDAGESWTEIFNTSWWHPDKELGAHIHLVSIDPYDGWIYVGVGDMQYVSCSILISRDGGQTWEPRGVTGRDIVDEVGFLAATYPDPHRVFFYADSVATGYEYIKATGEMRLLFKGEGFGRSKVYAAVTGEHGISYMAMYDYAGKEAGRIWMTVDGSSWYQIGDVQGLCLRLHDGRIYSTRMQFNDLTKEEAIQLIAHHERSVDMLQGSARYINVNEAMKDVAITVTGKTIRNYISNPSFEDGTTGWYIQVPGVDNARTDTEVATHGEASLAFEVSSSGYCVIQKKNIDMPLSGTPVVLNVDLRKNATVTAPVRDVYVEIKYWDAVQGQNRTKVMYLGGDVGGGKNYMVDQWMSYTAFWIEPPTGILKSIMMQFYSRDVTYYLDRFSLSEYTMWVDGETSSGNVSFMFGDHLIEAGELAEGESVTIELPSDVWLDGLVPIVPLTGLAYTVSIDGTPVTAADESIRETNRLLTQTLPLIVGLAIIGALLAAVGRMRF